MAAVQIPNHWTIRDVPEVVLRLQVSGQKYFPDPSFPLPAPPSSPLLPPLPLLHSISFPAVLGVAMGTAGKGPPEQGPSAEPSLLYLKGTQTTNCLETRLLVNN